ncbi:MAG TPA: hypothetical protein VFO24_02490, partial [Usitatibacter sp.]|nr:hypothetical protein [Usitatibacter sp.]
DGTGNRTFTCADGTGTFIARFDAQIEHVQGSTGAWTIVAGSGSYADLRGAGTARIDTASVDASGNAVFTDTWTGVVAFDVTAPTGAITSVKLTRPRSPKRAWRAIVSFTAADDVPGNAVSYQAEVTAGAFFSLRRGTLAGGAGSFRFAFERPPRTHVLQVQIALRDPVGNQVTLKRKVKLR